MKVGGRTVEVSNRDKVFFPEGDLTKGDLIDYYHHRVAEHLLPHVRDRMIFDLDPPGDDAESTFDLVRWTARKLRDLLIELGLTPWVMTSGCRGLHIHVPLDRKSDCDEVRSFAMDVSDLLVARHPERLTREQRKAR